MIAIATGLLCQHLSSQDFFWVGYYELKPHVNMKCCCCCCLLQCAPIYIYLNQTVLAVQLSYLKRSFSSSFQSLVAFNIRNSLISSTNLSVSLLFTKSKSFINKLTCIKHRSLKYSSFNSSNSKKIGLSFLLFQ